VNEVRHPSDGRLCIRQQRIAGGAIGEVADPWHGQFGMGRGF
jgi:hypothetical protein